MSLPHKRNRGFLLPPTLEEVEALAAADDLELAAGESQELLPFVRALVASASAAEELEPPLIRVEHTRRDVGYTPGPQEDPLNVFTRKCRIEGASSGPLSGRRIGVKDNISVAGIPTTNASRISSYTPLVDAVVVERILDAGGTITGKLNMDEFGTSGTGESSAYGPPRNPVNPAHSAGGSSGGSAAAVRGGEVDLALAVDQGGSGRIPSAFCGTVCIKPTHGLVPSFGVTHIDHTIDFVTPVALSIADTAQVLGVIAGPDWRDPQWVRGAIEAGSYLAARDHCPVGLRVGIVDEACDATICEPPVLEGLARAAESLREAGALVERVSIPIWCHALSIFQPYVACLVANMVRSEGEGYGHLGYIDVDSMHAFAVARRAESRELAPTLKGWMIAERYLHQRYMNVPYGRLHNLRLLVRQSISAALSQHDVLLTPTLPMTAPRLLEGPAPVGEVIQRTAQWLCYNTAPLNMSGHPALSFPSGCDEAGLPTAVQVVGKHFDEYSVFRAGFALEERLGSPDVRRPGPV
jgi:amidase